MLQGNPPRLSLPLSHPSTLQLSSEEHKNKPNASRPANVGYAGEIYHHMFLQLKIGTTCLSVLCFPFPVSVSEVERATKVKQTKADVRQNFQLLQ